MPRGLLQLRCLGAEHSSRRRAAVIPPRSNRKQLREFDTHQYKDRNLIERFFNRLKQFRRITSRFEKLALNYLSILNLVCAYIWLA